MGMIAADLLLARHKMQQVKHTQATGQVENIYLRHIGSSMCYSPYRRPVVYRLLVPAWRYRNLESSEKGFSVQSTRSVSQLDACDLPKKVTGLEHGRRYH